MTSITSEFIKKKAREISYALNRVSFYIKREELRNRLERLSFEFLENVAIAGEDVSDKACLIKVFKNLSALDVLVRIGHSLYEIETINSNILVRELDSFNSAIRQLAGISSAIGNSSEIGNMNSANSMASKELNLESIFSNPPAIIPQSKNNSSEKVTGTGKLDQKINLELIAKQKDIVEQAYLNLNGEKKNIENNSFNKTGESSDINQTITKRIQTDINQHVRDESGNRTIRQNLIYERIRQSGKANVKELSNQFPGVSERTLRYDLQRLCDRGVVEKIGSSGPGTSYALKDNSAK